MTDNQLQSFLRAAEADQAFREKLKAAASLGDFLEIVKAAGFDVSEADWLAHQNHANEAPELSDEELQGVAGGINININANSIYKCKVEVVQQSTDDWWNPFD